jgi:hypothetical protein
MSCASVNCGARRDRTADLLLAKQALSRLSYGPPGPLKLTAKKRLPRTIGAEPPKQAPPNEWWVWVDLNHRPHPYQGCALTN